MNSIKDLSDEELYNLINLKSHNELSKEDIDYLISIIRNAIKEIDDENYSKN